MAVSAMAEAAQQPTAPLRRQRLGDFYDLEFCRLSLMTLSGADPRRVGTEFRRSSERYVATLFDGCVEEVVEAERLEHAPDRRGFALFATGGNAREDPYDVDYDLFAVLTTDDPEKRRFFNRVLARLTRAITERAIAPHNRFTDRFGAYLATCDEIAGFFRRRERDAFIEKTELLGSRRVAGDPEVDAALRRELVEPFVFDDPMYPLDLVEEIRGRRAGRDGDEMEVKEAPGGLRDVQLLLSILKARVRVRQPDGADLFARLRRELPSLAGTLSEIEETLSFLKRVRDVYRLTVVIEDRLDPRYFGVVALFMGYGDRPGGGARDLLHDYRAALSRMRAALRACLAGLGLPVEGV
jgi:UTP:GlnB (protein PII) uridylyltransferase